MFFVYYHDGWCESGDHGIEEFDTLEKAKEFIVGRMRYHGINTDIEVINGIYTIIDGKQLRIKVKKVVEEISIEN